MSYAAECAQCGVIETGDLEAVGNAVEDHDQFHDVQVQRVATDGGVTEESLREATKAFFDDDANIESVEYSPQRDVGMVVATVEEVDAGFGGTETFDVEKFDNHLREHGFEYTGYVPLSGMTQVNVESASERDDSLVTDGGGYECDACGDTFETLSRLRLHEKDDCPERQRFADLDPSDSDVGLQAAGEALTCRGCGAEHSDIDFEETPSFADGDYHLIIEFTCPQCGFDNENRVVLEGVDREHLDQLPPHLQPDDNEIATDGGQDEDGPFFVVDEHSATVLSGPFDTRDEARTDAEDRDGRLLIATRAVLDMIELTSTASLSWDEDAQKPVTDGGRELSAPEAGYPYDALSALVDVSEARFLEHVDEHGRGDNWTGYAPAWFAWKAVQNLVTAFPEDDSVDLDEAGDALNYLLFAIDAAHTDDAITDGAGDVVTWRLECMDCDYQEDVDVHDADETPPRKVEREVARHKHQADESHIVRVHRRPDQQDIDPSLLTDGGSDDDGAEPWCDWCQKEFRNGPSWKVESTAVTGYFCSRACAEQWGNAATTPERIDQPDVATDGGQPHDNDWLDVELVLGADRPKDQQVRLDVSSATVVDRDDARLEITLADDGVEDYLAELGLKHGTDEFATDGGQRTPAAGGPATHPGVDTAAAQSILDSLDDRRLYYSAGNSTTGTDRVFHVDEDCQRLARAKTTTSCSVYRRPRGHLCSQCVPADVTLEDLDDALDAGGRDA